MGVLQAVAHLNMDIAIPFGVSYSRMGRIQITTLILMLSVMFARDLQAQAPQPADTTDLPVISEEISKISYQSLQQRSPTGALLRSLALPGWGQLYNRKYIKAFVVAGLETFLIVEAVRFWDLAEQAYDEFSSVDDPTLRLLYYYDYDFYRDRRNLFLYFSGVTIFLSMIDAYVDAHLQNFDVDITPSFDEEDPESFGLSLTFTF